MCFYKSGNGKLYSNEELNGAYLVAKRKYPNLSAEQYRKKLAVELDGLNKLPFSTVSELCTNGMPEEASMLYARTNGCSIEQARFVVSLLCVDGRC